MAPVAQPDPSRDLRGEHFLIVGFTALTGLSAAHWFERHGIPYRISELRPRAEIDPLLVGLTVPPEQVMTGPQTPDQLEGITAILLSPGVPRAIPLIREAERRGLCVYSDIDWLYPFIRGRKLVAITGTDGKTTTTTLTGALLGTMGRVVVAGNIGVPVLDRYEAMLESDYVVLEVSSFMLEDHRRFRADVSTVLNLAEDHLDRYPDFEAYVQAKLRITRHSTERDLFVKNLDHPRLAAFHPGRARVRTVSRHGPADIAYADGLFHYGGEHLARRDCALRGEHLVEDVLVALAVASEFGVPAARVREVLAGFRGVPHRFEYVGEIGGIHVYDDSKATSVAAISGALRSLSTGPSAAPVVLIVGGREKWLDFTPLRSQRDAIRGLVCYGEAGPRIASAVQHPCTSCVVPFRSAVSEAWRCCRPGDALLLSPGCTSWDQFPSYVERGWAFRQGVLEEAGSP
jgi:UDP-N-acetylmuramoylalanine--D-glutamate ligase